MPYPKIPFRDACSRRTGQGERKITYAEDRRESMQCLAASPPPPVHACIPRCESITYPDAGEHAGESSHDNSSIMMRLRFRSVGILITVTLVLLGVPSTLDAQSGRAADVTVFAAASLTEAFRTLGRQFEAAHPGTRLQFNFAGSQQLVQQLALGAKADLFAAADRKQMNAASAAGVVNTATIRIFA